MRARPVILAFLFILLLALVVSQLLSDEILLLENNPGGGDAPPQVVQQQPTTILRMVTPQPSVTIPQQHLTSSPTTPAITSLTHLQNMFRSKRVIVTQTDNRLFRTLYESFTPSDNFTASTFAIGPLSLQRWAYAQNLGYLFFSSPEQCPEPKSKVHLAPYWCKVPGMMLVTRIAQLCGVQYVMFLDSDVIPADRSMKLEDVLARMDAAPTAQFAVVPDSQHWSRLLHWYGDIYARALNSGAILIRVGAPALAMMDTWWNVLTAEKTPFELQMSRIQVHVSATRAEFWDTSGNLNHSWAENRLNDGLGQFMTKIEKLNVERAKPNVVFDLVPRAGGYRVFWDHLAPKCCLGVNATCFHVFNDMPAAGKSLPGSFRCDRKFRDTLMGWPGDQDRLNWLQDQNKSLFIYERDLSHGCNHASSNLKGMLFNHMCFSSNTKAYYSQIEGLEMMVKDMKAELETQSWDKVRTTWEKNVGWATLKRELVSFAFPTASSNMAVESLLQMVEQGNFLVTNVGGG